MKDILDKIKPIFKKIKEFLLKCKDKCVVLLEKIKPVLNIVVAFLKKHKRYVGVVCLYICMVVVLAFFTGDAFNASRIAKENSKTVSGEDYVPDAEFEVNAYAEVNELISMYFDAYVSQDFETLKTIATPISDMEMSYISAMSPYYEAYENITCYTKHGLSKDSYIVSVTFDIRFVGYETTAPSMVLFYVQTAEDGSLYINNLYSDFNMMYHESEINQDVYTALRKYTTQDDYLQLYNQVEDEFNALIKSDTDIYTLTKRTIPGVRQVWEDTVFYVEQETETTEVAEETEEEEVVVEEEVEEETPVEEEEETAEKIKIANVSSSLKVRKGPGKSYDSIGDVYSGDTFEKLGEEADGDGYTWIKIQYTDSTVGYVRSDFTQEVTE